MKVIIAAVTAVSVLAGATAPAGAADPTSVGIEAHEAKTKYRKYKKKRRYHASYHYYQHWADKLPIGTSAWWQQMDRESRGGRRP